MTETKTLPADKPNGLFRELPLKRRQFLESRLKVVAFPSGAEIISQGQTGDFLGIVVSGQVRIENGQAQARTIGAGEDFGSEMLRYGKPSAYTVTAQSDTILQVLERSAWLTPSPASEPRSLPSRFSRLKRSTWIALIAALALALTAAVLGPSLLDYSNAVLPDRLVEADRADLARDYLLFALQLKPDSANLYGKLGDVLVLQGQEAEAVEAYQQALTRDEYLPWIHNNLGVLLLEQGLFALAGDHFERALELDPENTQVYQNLGNAYYAQDQLLATADAYQKALELDFTLLDVKAAWAGLILYENRLVEARLVWEDVLKADPRYPLALQGLGVVALLEDDPALAMMYLDAARYLEPEDPTTHLFIGMAWDALEKPRQAADQYRYVLEHASDSDLLELADALLEVAAGAEPLSAGDEAPDSNVE